MLSFNINSAPVPRHYYCLQVLAVHQRSHGSGSSDQASHVWRRQQLAYDLVYLDDENRESEVSYTEDCLILVVVACALLLQKTLTCLTDSAQARLVFCIHTQREHQSIRVRSRPESYLSQSSDSCRFAGVFHNVERAPRLNYSGVSIRISNKRPRPRRGRRQSRMYSSKHRKKKAVATLAQP